MSVNFEYTTHIQKGQKYEQGTHVHMKKCVRGTYFEIREYLSMAHFIFSICQGHISSDLIDMCT